MTKVQESSPTTQTTAGSARPVKQQYRPALATIFFLLALSGLIISAYSNVLFNFFLGDDFGLLIWIKGAMQYPEVLLRDFTGSWLNSPTAQHYRPLISVTILLDHLLYGFNATGFHLTNILSLVAAAICFYFIVAGLIVRDRTQAPLWPFIAALLFGLHPLHPESIAWIIGRVDSVCIAFYLGSMLMYMRWRSGKGRWNLIASLSCMALSLLSKEMGIIIPATLAAYELVVVAGDEKRTVLQHTREMLVRTAPFWLLLAGYFVLRRLTLGTFFGSYDDSPLLAADTNTIIHNWQQGLRNLIVVPANRELMSSHHPLVIMWQICLVPCALLALFSLRQPVLRRGALFCLIWFALSLAPVYKLFSITDILQNSRYGYLATAPLCGMLTIGLAYAWEKLRQWHTELSAGARNSLASTLLPRSGLLLVCAVSLTMLVVSFLMLRVNNSAWAYAGTTSNAICAQLEKFYKANAGDPQVLLVNLPDSVHGCYVCRNAVGGMTQTPIISRDVHNCSMINGFDRLQPFGYLKGSLLCNHNQVSILAWNQEQLSLEPVSLSPAAAANPAQLCLAGTPLIGSVTPLRNSCSVTADGQAVVIAAKNNKRPQVEIHLPHLLQCFPTDFIAIDVETNPTQTSGPADLEFSNNIISQFESDDLIRAFLSAPNANGRQTAIFALRSHPTWVLGGETNRLMLRLPAGTATRLSAIRSIAAEEIMPLVSFDNSGWLGTKGNICFTGTNDTVVLNYDVSKVKGAAGANLEMAKRNFPFEWPNSPDEKGTILATHASPTGTFALSRKNFPDIGMYELRCRAIDAHGTRLGVASDHVVTYLNK